MAAYSILWAATACTTAARGPRPIQLSPCGRVFVFVDHGRPAATILIPEGAGETERRAAEILRTSILKMSGVDLPVREAPEPTGPGVAAIGFPHRFLPPNVAPSHPTHHTDRFHIKIGSAS